MRAHKPHAKLSIHLDSEGWLQIWDGHETVDLPPEDIEELRKFLACPGSGSDPEQEGKPA